MLSANNEMSKKFKSQASSARAASGFGGGFGTFQTSSSPLSYVTEQPDLSQVSPPSAVVAFKNLGKKDSTTKAKALEELQEICSNGVEDAVLTAWSDIYPRTSIDNSRRVRQLAHTIQGNLTVSSGKRIVSTLPKVIGAWLAGTFDSDKSVARTAQDALEKSFSTPEKRRSVWKIYNDSLFEYVEDAITIQTRGTLSDERTTSPDDAEAKYVRVVGTAMHMLDRMLKEGNGSELLTPKLWQYVYHNDAYLRRGACVLVMTAKDLDWLVISTCFLAKGLHSNQAGSSRQYTQALLNLTQRRPELWTGDYAGKSSIDKRLSQFLRQGSQNGPEDVWTNIGQLLREIPDIAAPGIILDALRTGVTTERVNSTAAWDAYVETCLWLATKVDNKAEFLDTNLMPIVAQYVTKDGDWTNNYRISQKIVIEVHKIDLKVLEKTWSELASQTIEKMRLSQPETSKEFRTSQDAVASQAERLFSLKKGLPQFAQESDTMMLGSAIDLLRSRNGKPYSAASIIELISKQPGYRKDAQLEKFIQEDVAELLDSPSSTKLVAISILCEHDISEHLIQRGSANAEDGLVYYLQTTKDLSSQLQAALQTRLHIQGGYRFFVAIMGNQALDDVQDVLLRDLQEQLSSGDRSAAMELLEAVLSSSRSARSLTNEERRSEILSQLLVISDSQGDISEKAASLVSKLGLKSDTGTASIVQQQLDGKGTPLSIFTLIDLANGVMQEKNDPNSVVPTNDQWAQALRPHLTSPRPYSLTITSALQGVLYKIEGGVNQNNEERDQDDFSLIFRLILLVTKLNVNISQLDDRRRHALYQYLPIGLQLVNEKLTVESASEIWLQSTLEIIQEATEALSDGYKMISAHLDDFNQEWLPRMHQAQGTSVEAYCTALAWVGITSEYVDRHGPSRLLQEYDQELKSVHRSKDIVQSAALLAVLRDHVLSSPHGKRLCNELVVDATDGKDVAIILLNVLLQGQSEALETIPSQRVVFLLKGLVKVWSTTQIEAEVVKLLAAILPLIADIYGDHWEQIVTHLKEKWATDLDLSILNASLRLFARLKNLHGEDVNEDLQEALTMAKTDLDQNLLNQLVLFGRGTNVDQPRRITIDLLRRQLRVIEVKTDLDLFELLSSPVEAVQTAVYEILHRSIPEQQEQLSLDLLLEKTDVHLPENLLGMLDSLEGRPYMLTWNLIFDHFVKASFKLREAYSADMKMSGATDGLLTRVCEVIRLTNQPINASKFDIQNFEVESDDEVQRLAVHLYFNCLLYLPSLAKEWFISQKNRVKAPLETWTQKYISPALVVASLSAVSDWANLQGDEDRALEIKTSPRGSELVASIIIDPENPPISLAVSLSGSYPLESPTVASRTRVGVSEKNWQSWLRTFQIIIFSTGNIIEGLIAFKRNVQGALKGQSECAICYSIIGTDMQTPNKKCGTCKNTFHGSCLFRWFKSSNSSSCPLCRNNFNYA